MKAIDLRYLRFALVGAVLALLVAGLWELHAALGLLAFFAVTHMATRKVYGCNRKGTDQ